MSSGGRRAGLGKAAVLAGVSLVLTWASSAHAFVVKHTAGGQVVHWDGAHVSYVVDGSVSHAADGASAAVSGAAQGWSGASGAPTLSTSSGSGASRPAVDGKNTVLYAADGYAPAGAALAITVLSFDESTGAIVDADIVINGKRRFAVLPAGATAPAGTRPVSTEGAASSGDDQVFDLQHVVAHEVGHSLGLGDDPTEQAALMYPYSMPDDATVRSPESDDLAGIDAAYAGQTEAPASRGCGGASVAGGRVGQRDAWMAWALVAMAGAWLLSRRGARILVPCGAACVVIASSAAPARSAVEPGVALADATARVVNVETTNVAGVFETVVDLVPSRCVRPEACPARVRAHAWGGTLGGITQQVGEMPAPRLNDEVELAFTGTLSDGVNAQASLLTVRSR